MVMLYEIEDISRFPREQDFASYCRLVKPAKESNGKNYGHSGQEDRQRPSALGFWRSGGADAQGEQAGAAGGATTRQQARQGQGPGDPGASPRSRRLLHA